MGTAPLGSESHGHQMANVHSQRSILKPGDRVTNPPTAFPSLHWCQAWGPGHQASTPHPGVRGLWTCWLPQRILGMLACGSGQPVLKDFPPNQQCLIDFWGQRDFPCPSTSFSFSTPDFEVPACAQPEGPSSHLSPCAASPGLG